MLALIENGQVTSSIIYDFVHDIIYHAERGKWAYENGQKISVSERLLDRSYMSCEIKTKNEENRDLLSFLDRKTILMHHISAGYEYVLVATGKIEGRIVYDGFGKDYDYAAWSLLVSEAGGAVKNFKSDTYSYANLNFIASNQYVYNELVNVKDSIDKYMK